MTPLKKPRHRRSSSTSLSELTPPQLYNPIDQNKHPVSYNTLGQVPGADVIKYVEESTNLVLEKQVIVEDLLVVGVQQGGMRRQARDIGEVQQEELGWGVFESGFLSQRISKKQGHDYIRKKRDKLVCFNFLSANAGELADLGTLSSHSKVFYSKYLKIR